MIHRALREVLELYPRVFLACHRRHVHDPRTQSLLSARQARVLDHLDAVQPTHLRDLASHLGVTASSMSLMVDRLEQGGYVRRSRDSGDARRVNLRLTRAGLRIKAQQKVLDPRLVRAMLQKLDARQIDAAVRGLQVLAAAAAQIQSASRAQSGQGRAA